MINGERGGKGGVWCFGSTFLFCRVNSAFFHRKAELSGCFLVGWLAERRKLSVF